MSECKILKERVSPSEVHPRQLTNDCYFVRHSGGQTDIARGGGMVRIFDTYHDLGRRVERIWHCGGRRNPRFQEPEL